MSVRDLLELATFVVTIVALPFAVWVFLAEQRKERENEEDEVYQLLSDNYEEFLHEISRLIPVLRVRWDEFWEVERLAEAMVQETRLPLPLARLLVARGVTPADAAAFLDPQLRDLLPDPRRLKDMDRAAARFLRAVKGRDAVVSALDVARPCGETLVISSVSFATVAGTSSVATVTSE